MRRHRVWKNWMGTAALAAVSWGCQCESEKSPPKEKPAESAAADEEPAPAPTPQKLQAPLRGDALALTPSALFLADEDHRVLRRVSLPLSEKSSVGDIALPGAPAQLAAFEGTLAVTIRSPAQLRLYSLTSESLEHKKTIELPDDAWGLAISGDRKSAYVTSPWISRVSAIDLQKMELRWDFKVKREPRGIAVHPDGKTLYISHLTSQHVTRLVDDGSQPQESIFDVPASPLRSPDNTKLTSSLGYSAVLSRDGSELFLPRHALGALGKNSWFGAMTVDVFDTKNEKPKTPVRAWGKFGKKSAIAATLNSGKDTDFLSQSLSPVTQPRAAVFRNKSKTLLVAGEGDDRIVEFAADAVDPTLAVVNKWELAGERHKIFDTATVCGAPTGLALSSNEDLLYVYCRTTDSIVEVDLTESGSAPRSLLTLTEKPKEQGAGLGRSLFFNATDRVMSGGLACAGCHPEGRDDGHVWHEARFLTADGWRVNFVGHEANIPKTAHTKGVPRRTPLLAGRLKSKGPFGWHGESPSLPEREEAGFTLHRWGGMVEVANVTLRSRALFLAKYLREELVEPPRQVGEELTAQQKRGEELFLSKETECAVCHVPDTNYTNQEPFPLPALTTRRGFDQEKDQAFKTPSLRSLFGRAPYFHDGSAGSLFSLIETNHDRMGKTSHLSRADRDALIAFLETL